ncbi:MAG: YdbL family protein [Pseudomonadota bacterium]
MKLILTSLLLLISLSIMSPNVVAQELSLQQAMEQLSDAKEQGLVGEQPDGYLGVVESTATAQQIAERINEARRQEYSRIANDNDIAVADVELLAGKRAIERTKSGHYVKIDGEWRQKP